jgi:hypothetical protein
MDDPERKPEDNKLLAHVFSFLFMGGALTAVVSAIAAGSASLFS